MYSPRIKDEQIKKLYILSKKFKVPMTKLVRVAIEEYLLKHEGLILEEIKGTGGIAYVGVKNAPQSQLERKNAGKK